MTNQEAKFILGAYRPNGSDTGDPMFAEALAQSERDPELRAWLERQRVFDAAVADKLYAIAPPPELRAAILAGSRASRPRTRWWSSPLWLAAAAAVVIAAAVSVTILPSSGTSDLSMLADFALTDMAESHDQHVGYPPTLAGLQAELSATRTPLTTAGAIRIDLEELRRRNCRSVRVGGRDIFEICFERDGNWYHLYMARHDEPKAGNEPKPLTMARGSYAAASWTDSNHVYALVASDEATLRRLI